MAEFLSNEEIEALLKIAEQGEDIKDGEDSLVDYSDSGESIMPDGPAWYEERKEVDDIDLDQEWRCYHFGNFYMSSIQQGIQAAHAQMELFNKYSCHRFNDNMIDDTPAPDMLYEWSNKWKTMICLNGGMNCDLQDIMEEICTTDNPYPFSMFYESQEALGGILTNIAVVLPHRIFDTAEKIRSRKYQLEGTEVHLYRKPDPNPTFGGYMTEREPIIKLSKAEVRIIEILNQCGLAR